MQTRSSSKLSRDQTSNPTSSTNPTPKCQIHRSSKQKVENSNFEEHLPPVATMTDNRTMAEMLRAPTKGCAETIMGQPASGSKKNPRQKFNESFHEAWERYKDLIRACPHHVFTELHQLDTFYNALNPADQDSLNAAAGGNLLEKSPQDALTIIENKSKVHNSRSKPIASPVNACDISSSSEIAKLTHAVNQQTSAVTTAMTAMLKQLQANPPPAQVKDVEEICVTCRGSGSLPGNTVANPKGELKAITTRSGLVIDGPTVPTPPKSVTPEDDECVEETYTDPDLAEYTIKVSPPPVQKPKPPVQRNFVLHTKDSHLLSISELKCKALADLGASINMMPLSVWKKLGLPDLIPTCMTLELANRAICTPDGIARYVFVPVGKFIFPVDFVVVDYESDPRVPLILGRPFLRTARALIDVHGEEMILRDEDERLTLNMKHDTTSYSNHPHKESANLINIFNVSREDYHEVLVLNQQSGNPTFSLHKEITSPKVTHEIHDSEGCTFLSEELPDIDSFNDIHPYFDDNPLSGSTTYSSNSLLEEFTDELALITYPSDYDDNLKCDIESNLREIEFLFYQGEDSDLKDSIDQTDLANRDDLFVDPIPEMFTDEHAPDYSFLPRFDVYDADNFYDDTFDSKGEKIKESELLLDELDLPCDILPYSEYDSFNSQDFSRDDDLPSPDTEDKLSSVPGYMKTLANGFCTQVFISSVLIGNHVKENQEKDKIRSNRTKTESVAKPGKVKVNHRGKAMQSSKFQAEWTSNDNPYLTIGTEVVKKPNMSPSYIQTVTVPVHHQKIPPRR
uniref:Reverse transcriptase domain-containing protein n=1 Tax=Tanacetum cinerariifolium TaxID=118510 RepID=A0A6L2JWY5_TANCI|nr:reverse transcriptase domain-containing protein [Tanacetum cinerariifolium]